MADDPAHLYGLRLTEDDIHHALGVPNPKRIRDDLAEAVRRTAALHDPIGSPYAPGSRIIDSDMLGDLLGPLRRQFDGMLLHPTEWARQIDGYLEELTAALDEPVCRVELTWEPLYTLPSGATLWRRP